MRKTVLIALFLAVFSFSFFCQNLNAAYESSPWVQDFHQLIGEMSAHYANLEFAVNDRKMDLPALRKETEARLRDAKDEREAQRVFQKFVDSFGDGHLEIDWKHATTSSSPPEPRDMCGKLGYNARLKPGLSFSAVPTFSPLETAAGQLFPGGLLRLPSGKSVGILRIGLFSEHAFPELCHAAIAKLHVSEEANCDDECENQIELNVANSLTATLAKREAELRSASASALLVDITHNGGVPTGWKPQAARSARRRCALRD